MASSTPVHIPPDLGDGDEDDEEDEAGGLYLTTENFFFFLKSIWVYLQYSFWPQF